MRATDEEVVRAIPACSSTCEFSDRRIYLAVKLPSHHSASQAKLGFSQT